VRHAAGAGDRARGGAGFEVGQVYEDARAISIVVRVPPDTALDHLVATGLAGESVPRSVVVAVSTEPELRAILRADGRRYTALRVFTTTDEVRAALRAALDGMPGVSTRSGSSGTGIGSP
jgi:hypothetical protein